MYTWFAELMHVHVHVLICMVSLSAGYMYMYICIYMCVPCMQCSSVYGYTQFTYNY